MTDLIEKVAEAIRPEIEKTFHDGRLNAKARRGKACILDIADSRSARAALSVIKENAGDLVRPLEWREGLFGGYRSVCGSYEIRIILGRRNRTLRLLFSQFGSGQDMGEFVGENAEAKAKAAAQEHNTARVLSTLNLEVE